MNKHQIDVMAEVLKKLASRAIEKNKEKMFNDSLLDDNCDKLTFKITVEIDGNARKTLREELRTVGES